VEGEASIVLADDNEEATDAMAAILDRHGWRQVHRVKTFEQLRFLLSIVVNLPLEPGMSW
jgi:hypothetical protein